MIKKLLIFLLVAFDLILILKLAVGSSNVALLNPQGFIAHQERNLILKNISIMSLIIIPAVLLAFFTAFKFRNGNSKAKYDPDAETGLLFQSALWLVPLMFVLVLAFNTWKATHNLDPYKSIESRVAPLTIQVVALRWKWLFIYPEQNIATVNFIQFPVHTPINFELTADAPMNSFWIPSLGGQIYAMAGMGTKTHLIADSAGDYPGFAAEINGAGFSGMKFVARASSESDFDFWVKSVKESSKKLDLAEYNKLASPSENNAVTFYSLGEENLYNKIIGKFTTPKVNSESGVQISQSSHN